MRLLPIVLGFLFNILSAQTAVHNLLDFYVVRQIERATGEARIAQVRELERKGWYWTDTLLYRLNQPGQGPDNIIRYDLAPFVDDDGEVEYLVTDVSPQFILGSQGLQDYCNDVLQNIISKYGSLEHGIYIRFSIGRDGRVGNVMPAQPPPASVPAAAMEECLDAVRYMPNWSPAIFKGKPVRACIMIPIGW